MTFKGQERLLRRFCWNCFSDQWYNWGMIQKIFRSSFLCIFYCWENLTEEVLCGVRVGQLSPFRNFQKRSLNWAILSIVAVHGKPLCHHSLAHVRLNNDFFESPVLIFVFVSDFQSSLLFAATLWAVMVAYKCVCGTTVWQTGRERFTFFYLPLFIIFEKTHWFRCFFVRLVYYIIERCKVFKRHFPVCFF